MKHSAANFLVTVYVMSAFVSIKGNNKLLLSSWLAKKAGFNVWQFDTLSTGIRCGWIFVNFWQRNSRRFLCQIREKI